jgi:hypothetical protein
LQKALLDLKQCKEQKREQGIKLTKQVKEAVDQSRADATKIKELEAKLSQQESGEEESAVVG